MQVEFAEELRPTLEEYNPVLQIQSAFLPEKDILERYLNRGYGNAYDFDQQNRLPIAIQREIAKKLIPGLWCWLIRNQEY